MFLPEGWQLKSEEHKDFLSTLEGMEEAMERGLILQGRAGRCDSGHNLWVDLPCCKGIIPRKEGALGIGEGTLRDIALIARVGRAVCFVITQITRNQKGEPVAVLSRRLAQERCRREYLSHLQAGDVIDVEITHLEPFGAFCDIGCGIASLIPIDAISVSRIFHPSDRFFPGQRVKAVVKGMDAQGKIHLTHKELLGTWEENAALFHPGETVIGRVRTVEHYGSFVELTPNLAGLAEPKEGVRAGQQAAVFIKSMIPEKMKVKLIVVDSFDTEAPLSQAQYFFQGTHMDRWQYSPDGCYKTMETVFE